MLSILFLSLQYAHAKTLGGQWGAPRVLVFYLKIKKGDYAAPR